MTLTHVDSETLTEKAKAKALHDHALFDQSYLVGGAVRDKLLGVDSKDNDYVVVGMTTEKMLSLDFILIGKDFPVFLHPISLDEWALARKERKTGVGYKGFAVNTDTNIDLEDDLARRDLTINAMAQDNQGNIIDPFNGQSDLENKILRHTTSAFTEDPVRVLRIARFMARYGYEWTIAPETQELMEQLRDSGELNTLIPDRVWKETEKALSENHPELFFITLLGLGIFPEIDAMVGTPQPKHHHPEGDVFLHTMLVLKRSAELGFDAETRFAALTHDFGKPVTFANNQNLYGHEADGVPIIDSFCKRLKVPNRFRQLATLTSDNHTLCHKAFELKPSTLYKLIVKNMDAVKQPARFIQFLNACQCDAQGRGELFTHMAYPQKQALTSMLDSLEQLDTSGVASMAISKGLKGVAIGEAIKVAQIDCIKKSLT